MLPHLLNLRGPGRYVPPGGGGEGDPGSEEPPIITTTGGGDVTVSGKIKPGSFGKIIVPLSAIAAGRKYTFRVVANFSRLAQQGKLAMVGVGFKTNNDFHIAGLRGDGSTGTDEYQVHGTPPNGWNKLTGHTEVNGGDATSGTQHSAYYQLTISADGTTYNLSTGTDGAAWTEIFADQALTPFSNVSSVIQFGVALWFNNADAGSYSFEVSEFLDEAIVAPFGAIVRKSANPANFDPDPVVTLTYDEEVLDNVGFHDNVTNNQRITVPAEHNGKLAMVMAFVRPTSYTGTYLSVTIKHFDSSDVLKRQSENRSRQGGGSSGNQSSVLGPVLLAAGDYFTVDMLAAGDSSVSMEANQCRFSLLILDDYINGSVLLKKASNLTAQNLTAGAAITFDTEVFDTNGFHDNGSNTELITIPSGVEYVIAFGQVSLSSVDASVLHVVSLEHQDSGGTLIRGWQQRIVNPTTVCRGNVCSGLIQVTAGERIRLTTSVATDTSVTIDADQTYLGLVSISASGIVGAMAVKSADQTSFDAFTGGMTSLLFNTDDFDTGGIHDTVSNTERLTVPDGIRYAVVNATVGNSLDGSDYFWIRVVHLDGLDVIRRSYNHLNAPGNSNTSKNSTLTFFTEVEEGDYFILQVLTSNDTSITIRANLTSFSAWFIP